MALKKIKGKPHHYWDIQNNADGSTRQYEVYRKGFSLPDGIFKLIQVTELQAKKKELTLGICSPGGDLNACFALVDVMKGSKIPIRTIGMGMIASCGLLMFISGTKGKRILTPNTSILSHQYSWGSFGKEHELFAAVKEFDLTTHRMVAHYKKCTGLSEKDIRKYLLPPEDIWLSAKEAKKLGLCDSITSTY